LMELFNQLSDFNAQPGKAPEADVFAVREALEALVIMLAPFAPHVAEEMWEGLGHGGGLLSEGREPARPRWPVADPELARREELEIPIQVNGKLRSRVVVAPGVSEEALREAALKDERVLALTNGREVVKVIVVPERLVNVVIR
jgi:leucyl-tRNA synthetase